MVDVNDMLIFARVAELEGISKAADAMQIPKSRVSRRLAQLESDLGVRLIERNTRSVRLTDSGLAYFQHCKRIEEEVQNAQESICDSHYGLSGMLRVSTSLTLGQYVIAPHLSRFNREYPGIQVDLNLSNRRVDLIAEGFDLAIRVGQIEDSSLICRRLGGDCAALYASPEYLEQHGEPTHPEQLKDFQVSCMPESSFAKVWHLVNKSDVTCKVTVSPWASVNDMTTLRMLAENSVGIVLLPRYLARESVGEGRLTAVLSEWRSPPFGFYALFPSRHGLTRKARAWLDFYQEYFAALGVNDG